MPKIYTYDTLFSKDIQQGMKKLHDMALEIDKVIKNIKVTPNSGEGLKTVNTELKKTDGYFKSLNSLQKQRLKQEKEQEKINTKKIKQAEKFNIQLQQRKANENALANEIRKHAREEAVLARELKQIAVLQAKEIKSDKELIRLNAMLIRKRANMVVKTREEREAYNQLTREIVRNEKQIRKADKSIGRFQRNVGNYTSSVKGFAATLGVSFGLIGIVRLFQNVGKIFKTFEKDVKRLQAIIGSDKNISALTKQAKDLGATTVFTAGQIIGLQTELAKLGFTVSEILSSTKGIQALAAATGTDLAEAATIAGSALKIFGLDASESARVADVLAKSTSISALDMQKLATALPTVGTTARIAGKSIERTTALLGVLSDRGLDASTSATSLRNIFLELSKQGITMEEALDRINGATDKNNESLKIFGKRSAAAGVIIAENTGSINELEQALINADGAAQDMADTMLDNLAGDITLAKSAWEGFVLSIEDGNGLISKILRTVTKGWTKFLGVLTELNKDNTSDVLEDQRNEVNRLAVSLTNANTSLEDRKKILEELKIISPEILGGLEAETLTYGELTESVKLYNEEIIKKIALAKLDEEEQEELNDASEKTITRVKKEAEVLQRIFDVNADIALGQGTLEEKVAAVNKELEAKQSLDLRQLKQTKDAIFEQDKINSAMVFYKLALDKENEALANVDSFQTRIEAMKELLGIQEELEENILETVTVTAKRDKPEESEEEKKKRQAAAKRAAAARKREREREFKAIQEFELSKFLLTTTNEKKINDFKLEQQKEALQNQIDFNSDLLEIEKKALKNRLELITKQKVLTGEAGRGGRGGDVEATIADAGQVTTDAAEAMAFAVDASEKKIKKRPSFLSRLLGVNDDELAAIKAQVSEIFNQVLNLWQERIESQRTINDELLAMSDERIAATQAELAAEEDKFQKSADAGQARDDQLVKDLEGRLKQEEALKQQALVKDKQLKQEQKRVDIVQANISIASGVLRALSLTPPYSFILAGIVAALGAVQLTRLAGAEYADGTRYLELNGNRPGRDTVPILADEGERILSKKQNAKIDRSFPNELIPEAIQFYKDDRSGTPILNIWNDELLEGIYNNTKDRGRAYDEKGRMTEEIIGNKKTFYSYD